MKNEELQLLEAQNKLAEINANFTKEQIWALELRGQVKQTVFEEKFLTFQRLEKLQRIKETKSYRGLPTIDEKTGEIKTINTFKEYCESVNLSVNTVDNELLNIRKLGEELYQASVKLGLSAREMRRLRSLPAEVLTDMSQKGYSEYDDKNRLLEALSELELKYEEKNEELNETKQQLEETRENYYAQERFIQNKNDHIDRISSDLAKAQRLIETMTPDEEGAKLREEVDVIAYSIKAAIVAKLKPAFDQLEKHQEKTNINHQQFMTGLIADLRLELNQIQNHFNLNDIANGDNTPDWARDDYEPIDYSEDIAKLYGEK